MKIKEARKSLYKLIPKLQDTIFREYETKFDHDELRQAMDLLIEFHLERLVENAETAFLTPRHELHHTLLEFLPNKNIFSGNRDFSYEKMAAMILYLAAVMKTRTLSKTRLNKLAFYSDFRSFSRTGKSISGSAYRHLPYGPVIDDHEQVIEKLNDLGICGLKKKKTKYGEIDFIFIIRQQKPLTDVLTTSEIETLNSVAEDFGKMNAGELTEVSHEEMAYKQTRTGDLIAYGFSKFLNDLPRD